MAPTRIHLLSERTRSPAGRVGYGLLWILAVIWLGFTLLRLFGGDWAWPIVVAIAYTPYVLAATAIPILLAIVLRAGRLLTLMVVCACALTVVLVPRATADSLPADGVSLRVMTVNARCGGADVDTVVSLVRDGEVDVLVVTELTGEVDAALGKAGLAESLSHQVAAPTAGADGTGIYSRYKLTEVPRLEPSGGNEMPAARVAVPGTEEVELIAVHPVTPDTAGSFRQWRHDLDQLPAADPDGAPRILAGDFNATLDHAAMRRLLDSGYLDAAATTGDGLTGTWRPGRFVPPIALDHVLTGSGALATGTAIHQVPGTDHAALLVTLTIAKPGE